MEKKKTLNKSIFSILLAIFLIGIISLMLGCNDENNTQRLFVYNTKNMTDEQITTYFSQSVLQDVKADNRNRTIIIYKIDESIPEQAEIKYKLYQGEQVYDNLNQYVDEDAPDVERTFKIMIGWDEVDLNKTWTVEIYYMNGEQRVELARTNIFVDEQEFTK